MKAQDLLSHIRPARKAGKPELACEFCKVFKGYSSIDGLWTHLVKKNPDASTDERLAEVKRTAGLWRAYWDQYSDSGKGNNWTYVRLRQAESPTFGWQDVLNWGVR